MNSKSLFAAFVVCTLMFVGNALASPFQGSYDGGYIVVASTQGASHGEMKLDIDAAGNVKGKGVNQVNNAKYDIVGHVDDVTGFFKGDLVGTNFKLHLEGTWHHHQLAPNGPKNDRLTGTVLQFTGPSSSDGAINLDLKGL
jgi:hypothetical protein